jgi:hypothetical protein
VPSDASTFQDHCPPHRPNLVTRRRGTSGIERAVKDRWNLRQVLVGEWVNSTFWMQSQKAKHRHNGTGDNDQKSEQSILANGNWRWLRTAAKRSEDGRRHLNREPLPSQSFAAGEVFGRNSGIVRTTSGAETDDIFQIQASSRNSHWRGSVNITVLLRPPLPQHNWAQIGLRFGPCPNGHLHFGIERLNA